MQRLGIGSWAYREPRFFGESRQPRKRFLPKIAPWVAAGALSLLGCGPSEPSHPGRYVFNSNCVSCHTLRGANSPLSMEYRAAHTDRFESVRKFTDYLRNPLPGMTRFPPARLSDKQAADLYDYILGEVGPKKTDGTASTADRPENSLKADADGQPAS